MVLQASAVKVGCAVAGRHARLAFLRQVGARALEQRPRRLQQVNLLEEMYKQLVGHSADSGAAVNSHQAALPRGGLRQLRLHDLFDQRPAVPHVDVRNKSKAAEHAVIAGLLLVPVRHGLGVPRGVGAVAVPGLLPQLIRGVEHLQVRDVSSICAFERVRSCYAELGASWSQKAPQVSSICALEPARCRAGCARRALFHRVRAQRAGRQHVAACMHEADVCSQHMHA
mmetsp:Transcript_28087/g.83233  ORF Transcript_28087/g.83233 Transcript_28087/m.83233 type:complete len:227 (+) Transcript_28087:430-1110(+)